MYYAIEYQDGDVGVIDAARDGGWIHLPSTEAASHVLMLHPARTKAAAHEIIAKRIRSAEKVEDGGSQ